MQRLKIARGLVSPKNPYRLCCRQIRALQEALAKNRTQMRCSAKDRRDLEDDSRA